MTEIEAMIEAAHIQGRYAIWAAIVGALGVILTIYFAAKNTVKQIKLEKVAESKRDQYIALTDAYTQFLVSTLKTLRPQGSSPEQVKETWDLHLAKYIELTGCVNKVCLVTTSEIRLEIIKLQNDINKYQTSFANYFLNNGILEPSDNLEMKVHEFAKLLRKDLGIENNLIVEDEISNLRSN